MGDKKSQHPSGPLKRTGTQAELWDKQVGKSLDVMPATQLPIIRNVLQRYRALRIEYPLENTTTLAKIILDEVTRIWDRARVPTVAPKNCLRKSETKIMENFKINMPKFIIMHWDGKLISYEQGHATEDRLAIVAGFPEPNIRDQYLASPCIPDGKGSSMCNALADTLEVWEIPHDIIIGISWDTTASNTGQHIGSATLFEQLLGRSVMWLACRHHMGELHVKHVDKIVRGGWEGKYYL